MIEAIRRLILDRFVLRPSQNELDIGHKRRMWYESDGHRDEYFVSDIPHSDIPHSDSKASAKPELLVVKFPGTAGRAERASDWPGDLLDQTSVRLCTWNAPGYGQSSGRASLTSIANRAQRFFSHLVSDLDPMKTSIWLVGNSLGCATATYVASEHRAVVCGLILRNPPPLIETVKRVANQYPLGIGNLAHPIAESLTPEMNLLLTASRVDCPTVMLQSELDELVPPELQNDVFDALRGPKRLVVLEGIGHAGLIHDQHQDEITKAIEWLWSHRAG